MIDKASHLFNISKSSRTSSQNSQRVKASTTYPKVRAKHSIRWLVITSIGVGLLGLAVLGALVIFGLYATIQYSDRILPGIKVGETQLEGLSINDAAIKLHQEWNLDREIVVSDGIHQVSVPIQQLGLRIDPIQSTLLSHNIGRGGNIINDFRQILQSYQNGWSVQPVVIFDTEIARNGLSKLSSQFSQPAKNATVKLEATEIIPVTGEMGYTINIEETLSSILEDPKKVINERELLLQLKPLIPQVNDVSQVMSVAQKYLDTQIILRTYDPVLDEYLDLTIPKESIASWMSITAGEDGLMVKLDENLISVYLSQLNNEIGPERWINADIYREPVTEAFQNKEPPLIILNHHPTSYQIQPGDTLLKIAWKIGIPTWKILEANPELDPDKLSVGTELIIPSKDELLPLPVIPNKRIIIDLGQQRLRVYQDRELIQTYLISTGVDKSPTQPGIFQVQTHKPNAYASVWDLHMPNFLGIYEAWPGFMNGIHGLPTLSNGQRLWGNILGRPASYGCIILDMKPSEWLYEWAEDGVIVEIQP